MFTANREMRVCMAGHQCYEHKLTCFPNRNNVISANTIRYHAICWYSSGMSMKTPCESLIDRTDHVTATCHGEKKRDAIMKKADVLCRHVLEKS
jgi:hypothetical protein